MKILVGDIGGTKTILATCEIDADGTDPKILYEERYVSTAYRALEPVVQAFVQAHDEPFDAACFGVAGPVVDHVSCQTTNLAWARIEAKSLSAILRGIAVSLVNDFESLAHGVVCASESQRIVLHPGLALDGAPRAVLGAGTGLGHASVLQTRTGYLVAASEGGHSDFAPRDELQIELLRWMLAGRSPDGPLDHVSTERIVSGPGLRNIYLFLREKQLHRESVAVRVRLDAGEDAGAVLGESALQDDALASAALNLFLSCYGAEAGNVALRLLARGGVILAGGIAEKILPRMSSGPFIQAYLAKGRYRSLVHSIPVVLVRGEQAALRGAAAAVLSGSIGFAKP